MSYVGLKVDANDVVADEKIRAIKEFPTPQDKLAVMRLLGMVNYLEKFVPNLLDTTVPLRKLLQKSVLFYWYPEQQAAFEKLKHVLTSSPVLALLTLTNQLNCMWIVLKVVLDVC